MWMGQHKVRYHICNLLTSVLIQNTYRILELTRIVDHLTPTLWTSWKSKLNIITTTPRAIDSSRRFMFCTHLIGKIGMLIKVCTYACSIDQDTGCHINITAVFYVYGKTKH